MLKPVEFGCEQNYINLFLAMPKSLYANNKCYRGENKNEVSTWPKGQHPCTSFLLQKNLLILDDGKPAARGIAFINKLGDFGSIGFFESENNPKALQMLVDCVVKFCVNHGITKIYAPMNGSIWNSYRIMTDGFDDPPFTGEPYNKEYYKNIFEQCGFKIVKTWDTQFAKKVPIRASVAKKFQKAQPQPKGIYIRSLKEHNEDIKSIHKVVMNSFANFFAFHEIDEQTFCNLYSGFKLVCDKETTKIAFNDKNEPVGFGIAVPDYKSKIGFLLKYAKRYIFLYLGTWQENGKSVYPQAGGPIVLSIMKNLFLRRKSYVSAMMSEDATTRKLSPMFEKTHQYALMELKIEHD